MRLSTRSEYGLRAMAALAARGMDHPVPLRELAASETISEQYLEQIFVELRRAGFVRSVRGAKGGYLLTRAAGEIGVAELLVVLEGDLAPYDCVASEVVACERANFCTTRQVWLRLREAMFEAMGSMTLEDLAHAPPEGALIQGRASGR